MGTRFVIPSISGDMLIVTSKGKITYNPRGEKATQFWEDELDAVEWVSAQDVAAAHTSGGRVAGGALAGGVLLGPLGLLAGGALGAAAKAAAGGNGTLILHFEDGCTLSMFIAPKFANKAQAAAQRFSGAHLIQAPADPVDPS